MARKATAEERNRIITAATNMIGAGVPRLEVIEMLFTAAASLSVLSVDDSACTDGSALCHACFVDRAEETYVKVNALHLRRSELAH